MLLHKIGFLYLSLDVHFVCAAHVNCTQESLHRRLTVAESVFH